MPKKSAASEKYLVFISHSHNDRWIARQIASLIEAKGRKHGVGTFLDEKDIEGGDSIPQSVRENIQGCHELLVLLTRNSIERPWVLIEIGAAWALEKRIVAIVDKVTPQEMPDIIAPFKAMDLNDLDDYLMQLVDRAKGGTK